MPEINTATTAIVEPTPWKGPLFTANTTADSFATIAPTLTKPVTTSGTTGRGIVDVRKSVLTLCFFGTDAANEAFDVKIVGWSKLLADVAGSDTPDSYKPNQTVMWVPRQLAFLTVTLGAATGAAGGNTPNGTSDLFADTIVEKATSGYATSAINIISPADDLVASVEVAHGGDQLIGVYFDRDTAASANALWKLT